MVLGGSVRGEGGVVAYRRHAGEVAGGECAALVVGPDVHVAFETEEDVVGLFVVVESNWLIGCGWC